MDVLTPAPACGPTTAHRADGLAQLPARRGQHQESVHGAHREQPPALCTAPQLWSHEVQDRLVGDLYRQAVHDAPLVHGRLRGFDIGLQDTALLGQGCQHLPHRLCEAAMACEMGAAR